MEVYTPTTPEIEQLRTKAKNAARFVTKTFDDRRLSILQARLQMGEYQYVLRQQIDSDRVYGARLAQDIPETGAMDAALRSNQLWLYKALHVPGSKGSDILEVSGIDGIEGFKSDNPTVLRRNYTKKKKRLEDQSSDI